MSFSLKKKKTGFLPVGDPEGAKDVLPPPLKLFSILKRVIKPEKKIKI